MDGDQIDNVARHPPVGCGGGLLCRQIGRVKHIPEQLIRQSGKETKIRIRHPFELGRLPHPLDRHRAFTGAAAGKPSDPKAGSDHHRDIAFGNGHKPRVAIMKNIDVGGKAGGPSRLRAILPAT